jgi:hypothetical protein
MFAGIAHVIGDGNPATQQIAAIVVTDERTKDGYISSMALDRGESRCVAAGNFIVFAIYDLLDFQSKAA